MHRGFGLALVLCILASAVAAPAGALTRGVVLNGSAPSGALVFDADTDSVLGFVPLGFAPTDCSVLSDQSLAFVSGFGDDPVVLDLAAVALAAGTNPIAVSGFELDTTITPDDAFLLTTSGVGGATSTEPIRVVDVATRTQVGSFPGRFQSVEVCADGAVLSTSVATDDLRRLTIDGAGVIADSGESIAAEGAFNVAGRRKKKRAVSGWSDVR